MSKNVLITGGAGFVGAHLANELIAHGYRVRVLDALLTQVHGDNQKWPAYLHPALELMEGDICNPVDVRRACRNIDIVYHLAARVGVGQSMYEVSRYTATNNGGTAVLLEELIQRPVGCLVVASSMSIYGEGLYQRPTGEVVPGHSRPLAQLKAEQWELADANGEPLRPIPTTEDKSPELASVYALSKYDQERMCMIVGNAYQIPTVALRFFNIYGSLQALSNPYTGVLAIFASRLLNVLSWWQAVHGVPAPPAWRTYQHHVRAGLQSADVVVAPTRAMLSTLQDHYGPFRNCVAIHNGCHAERFHSAPKEQLIFSIGRLWDDAKNITALEAVAGDVAWPIYVAGATQHPDGGERQLHGIHTLGVLPREQIIDWLSKAAIYALPARYEPFGLSALEAALSGCALVLSNIPTLRELWAGCALFVPPNEPAALRQALHRLITDEALRAELSAAAQQRARMLNATQMAEHYVTLYHLLNRRRLFPTLAPIKPVVGLPAPVLAPPIAPDRGWRGATALGHEVA